MCPPTFFDVTYSINPWMEPNKPIDADLAMAQWERLRDLYLELGHEVEFIEPVEGLPDMVFSANGATVVDGLVLLAKFRHAEQGEPQSRSCWSRAVFEGGVQAEDGQEQVRVVFDLPEGGGDLGMAGLADQPECQVT